MRSSRRPDRCWAALALLALAACTRPIPPLPAAPSADPLATLRARMAAVQTLRARFTATAQTPEGERTAAGVLITARPEALRLRLIAPFGLPVLDYVRRAGVASLWLPEQSADPAAAAPPGLLLLDRLDVDEAAPPGACQAFLVRETLTLYQCELPGGARRILHLDSRTATLRTVEDLTADTPALRRDYDDYRLVDGLPLPHRIRLVGVGPTRLEVVVDRWEVNPALPADAFVPAAGAVRVGMQRAALDRLTPTLSLRERGPDDAARDTHATPPPRGEGIGHGDR